MAWLANQTAVKILFVGLLAICAILAASRCADAQTTFQRRVVTGNDDAEEDSGDGSMYLDSSDLELAITPEGEDTIGIRFTSINVPPGATITNAYIQFTCDETSSGSTSLTIRGQNVDDAAGFTSTAFNISSRAKTSASVGWSPSAWNNEGQAGANERTPDIKSVIQEIVNRAGWASGNDIVIIITGTGTRTAESYEGSSTQAPQLTIQYTTGGGGSNTYYVRTDGSDSNSGTGSSAAEAWQTVSGAVKKSLIPGDVVYVQAGTYSGENKPSIVGASGNPIRFIADTDGDVTGWPAGDVILAAPSNKVVLQISNNHYLEFTGFKMQGATGKDGVQMANGDGVRITNCEIFGAGLNGVFIALGSLTLENCLIRDNSAKGIQQNNGTSVVMNCTIAGNISDGIELDNGNMTVTNSIIANNGDSGFDRNNGSLTHTYNLVWGNSGSNFEGTSASTGEISQDPQFTGGYELSSGSPAVDAGTASGAPLDDIDGNARPAGSGYDMGAYEYTPLVADLLGHWKLDETTGTTASDSSGNGNDGDLYGGVTFDVDAVSPGARGDALEFNGSSDYIQIPDDSTLQPTAALSIAAFVKGDTWGTGNEVNVVLRKGEGNPNNYQLAIADGQVALYLDDDDGNGIRGDTVLDANRWYHVAATWDGSLVRIYIDGVLDMTPVAYSGPINTDTRSLYIGGRSGADYFDGVLDDVRLYGKSLTQAEIMEIYGLLLHWKLDDGAGTLATDSTGSGRDGDITGGAAWTTGQIDGGLQFDGDDEVNRQNAEDFLNGLDAVSASVWVKADATDVDRGIFFSTDPAGSDNKFGLRYDQDGYNGGATSLIKASIDTTSGSASIESLSGTQSTSWQHLVLTWQSGSTLALYIDGQLAGLSAASGPRSGTITSVDRLLLGRGAKGENWLGGMDDFRLFNRALNPAEIDQLYQSGLPKGLRIIKWIEIQ